ncbi:MAG: NAD/FAD-binding protein, partial [Caldimonas sp.]
FWSMLRDLVRFYRNAPLDAARAGLMPLDDYLDEKGYGRAFREDHLYPMAAAIWSTPAARIGRYPTEAFVRFCENHQLLTLSERPAWRTVTGGSREYVKKLAAAVGVGVRSSRAALAVHRDARGVSIATGEGERRHDHAVIACHADQALSLLPDASSEERRLLGAFAYSRNRAVLHSDPALMPRRRAVWSSWNYSAERGRPDALSVTYWMNRLQGIDERLPLFLTLNPIRAPRRDLLHRTEVYEHPLFDAAAIRAQDELWSLQGRRRTWFCGAYFGAGFHEDGIQAGLAVAEAIGGVRRPWSVAGESARIRLPAALAAAKSATAA